MKKVVSLQEVAHLFAHQTQTEATNPNRSFYFYGKSLYSYGSHFCIAKFADNNTLLFTERGYSNTTAKHISIAHHATNHINKIYCPYPEGSHEDNFNYWLNDAEYISKKLLNARKPEKYLQELEIVFRKAFKYAEFFKISMPEILLSVTSVKDKAEAVEYIESKQKYIEAEKKRKEKQQADEHKQALKKWRAFEQRCLYFRNGFDYLRKDAENLETSQGVKLPLEVAKRYYERLGTLKAGDSILNYTISEINKQFIAIGCHKISLKEINSVMQ